MFALMRLIMLLVNMIGEHQSSQYERERRTRLSDWEPETWQEAKEARQDEKRLARAERYEESGQRKKALAIYRELARHSPVSEIVVKAKMGVKRVKQSQGSQGL
jgi:hypothetical protein